MIVMFNINNNTIIIPKDAIRFRVIANSNSKEDQNIKYLVRDALSYEIIKTIENSNNKTEASILLKEKIPFFENTIFDVLKDNSVSQRFNINYGINYFPEKIYNGVKYKEGEYESLVITLGDGLGDNWWCVLFPPLCLLEAEETDNSNVEYKFFLKEIIDKYF